MSCVRFLPTSFMSFLYVRADEIMNDYFGSLAYIDYVLIKALPTELLSQVIKYSSVGSAVAFLGQITLFEGRRQSEESAKFGILNGTLQLLFGC